MKNIIVQQAYYTIPELYRIASGSKARRGLAGYMIKTGRADNTIMGGAMYLLYGLESLKKNELYNLDRRESSKTNKEIMSLAETALAGKFHVDFEIPEKECRRMIQTLDKLPPLEG